MRQFIPRIRSVLLGVAASAVLSGCAMHAQPERMVPGSLALAPGSSTSVLYGGIAIGKVGGGEETDPLTVSKVGSAELQEALRESLARYGFLSASRAAAPYRLDAFLVELKQPISGFTMTVDSFVRYRVTRSSDAKVIYDEIVIGSHKATRADDFYGPARLKTANEGSIRANIAAFLERLNALER